MVVSTQSGFCEQEKTDVLVVYGDVEGVPWVLEWVSSSHVFLRLVSLTEAAVPGRTPAAKNSIWLCQTDAGRFLTLDLDQTTTNPRYSHSPRRSRTPGSLRAQLEPPSTPHTAPPTALLSIPPTHELSPRLAAHTPDEKAKPCDQPLPFTSQARALLFVSACAARSQHQHTTFPSPPTTTTDGTL